MTSTRHHINEAEFFAGIASLPKGRRRDALAAMADGLFTGRVLALNNLASRRYGDVIALRRAAGRPMASFDALIAAIAWGAGASVATRDAGAFSDCGVEVIDPWQE